MTVNNSASQALAEFKTQRLGGLMGGYSSEVGAPTIQGTSLSDTAAARLARNAPKKSSTAFLEQVRQNGARYNAQALSSLQARSQAMTPLAGTTTPGSAGYRVPTGGRPQTGGARGQYGLTIPAAQSFNALSAAAQRAGVGPLSVNSGGRTRAQQASLYAAYRAGRGNKAAPPGSSLHESGIAVDLGGQGHYSNTAQHAWLRQNAATFGWYWVGKNFGEDWHWEYHPEWNRQ